jgi:ArsR family transcriptional regulator
MVLPEKVSSLARMADLFAVIADPTRRQLLGLLLERRTSESASPPSSLPSVSGEISVGDMVAALGVSQPTVSKHLRVLRDAGLVRVREEGQHRYYSLDTTPLVEVDAWLAAFFPTEDESAVAPDLALGARAPRTSPVPVPASLRRAAENLPDVGDVGATLGRAVAGAQSRILDPVKKRLGHRDQS